VRLTWAHFCRSSRTEGGHSKWPSWVYFAGSPYFTNRVAKSAPALTIRASAGRISFTCARLVIKQAPQMLLKKIDYHTAAKFFESFEHLGNCGLGVWHWGAFVGDQLLGAVSFGTTGFAKSRGTIASVAAQFGLGIYQVCRGGTVHIAPPNTASAVLSSCMRSLREERGDCLVVAYSDRAFNEIGTIYQACNALYTGLTEPKNQANYLMFGKLTSGWVVRKRYGTRAIEKLKKHDPAAVKLPLSSKYRYVFVHAPPRKKAKIVAALRPLIQEYPNRTSENIGSMNGPALICERLRARQDERAESNSEHSSALE